MSGYYDSQGMGGIGGARGGRGGALLQALQFEQAHREQNRDMDDFRQALKDQASHDAAIHAQQAQDTTFKPGVMQPDGSIRAPYQMDAQGRPMMQNGQYINGAVTRDSNGIALQTPDALNNIAAQQRATQGYNVGQSSQAQIKSDMMRNLGQAIMGLPAEDRQMAYERAIGVMAGKGQLQLHDMPGWDKGGQEAMQAAATQKNQQEQAMQVLKNIGTSNEAMIKAGLDPATGKPSQVLGKDQTLLNPNQQPVQGAAGGSNLVNTLQTKLNDPNTSAIERNEIITAMQQLPGGSGGVGQPVGKPISGRVMDKYTNAFLTAQHADDLQKLLTTNPQMSITEAKLGNALGGSVNGALSPAQQQFNLLSGHLNDTLKTFNSNDVPKGQIDTMSKLLPTFGDNPATAAQKLSMLKEQAATMMQAADPSGHIAALIAQQKQAAQQPEGQPVMGMVAPAPGGAPPAAPIMPQGQPQGQPMPQQQQMPQPLQGGAMPPPLAPSQPAYNPNAASSFGAAPVLQPGDTMDYGSAT